MKTKFLPSKSEMIPELWKALPTLPEIFGFWGGERKIL
jgi:hypothetical protein